MAAAIAYPASSKPLPTIYIGESYNFKNSNLNEENSLNTDVADLPKGATVITHQPEINPESISQPNQKERLTAPLVLSIISISAIIFCVIVFYLFIYQENFTKNKFNYAHR
jgi:hypothetical protein